MELTRIIHPVGQGGFYSETFRNDSDEINIVYDCGGNSKSSIESYIENYYPSKLNRKIDAVFISHLHDDHINGLDYLLKKYNVKYLFLPQLTEDEKLEIMLCSVIKTGVVSDVIRQLLFDNTLEGRETIIIKVEHANRDNRLHEEINQGYYDLSDSNNSYNKLGKNKKIPSGTTIGLWDEWLFIPYNPPILYPSGNFYEHIKKGLKINDFDLEELPYIVMMKGLDECKMVYESYFGKNHNAYSMSLYSGLANSRNYYDDCEYLIHKMKRNCTNEECYFKLKKFCYHLLHHCNRKCFNRPSNPNCLYMGDFDTKRQLNNLARCSGIYWKEIGTIQVPHHGSRDNYQPELYEYAHKGFISVGERNIYHHPDVETLIGMEDMACKPVIVTESLSSMRMYHYSF